MNGTQAYALAKGYVNKTLVGVGALKGAPCQIQSMTDITGGHRVTFLWIDNSSVEHTDTMDVMDGHQGVDGLGIESVEINAQNHLIVTYTDGTTADAGEVDVGNGFSATATLSANGWSNNQQTITFTGYEATMNGVVGVPTTATTEQNEAYRNAGITVSQNGTSFTFTCETVPSIDLPVAFFGGGGEGGSGGEAVWGGITGTLSNQTDLQTALNAKVSETQMIAYINENVIGGVD